MSAAPSPQDVRRLVDSSRNVMAHGDVPEGKWRGNWRMEWVASTLHTTSEHGVSSITTVDVHNLAASSRPNGRPPPTDLNGLVRFSRKTKSDFCACAITFQPASTVRCMNTEGQLHTDAFLYTHSESARFSNCNYTDVTKLGNANSF